MSCKQGSTAWAPGFAFGQGRALAGLVPPVPRTTADRHTSFPPRFCSSNFALARCSTPSKRAPLGPHVHSVTISAYHAHQSLPSASSPPVFLLHTCACQHVSYSVGSRPLRSPHAWSSFALHHLLFGLQHVVHNAACQAATPLSAPLLPSRYASTLAPHVPTNGITTSLRSPDPTPLCKQHLQPDVRCRPYSHA